MTALTALLLVFTLFQIPNPVASFDGVFKSADKKFINIKVESGETMRMYVTHGTRFVLNGKPAKPADFHEGDRVTVDTERDNRMNLLAVKLENAKPEAEIPK